MAQGTKTAKVGPIEVTLIDDAVILTGPAAKLTAFLKANDEEWFLGAAGELVRWNDAGRIDHVEAIKDLERLLAETPSDHRVRAEIERHRRALGSYKGA